MGFVGGMIIIAIPLLALLGMLAVLYFKKANAFRAMSAKYSPVIDISREAEAQQALLAELTEKFDQLEHAHKERSDQLAAEYGQKRDIYERLLGEISVLEEDLEFTSFGLYKPHYDFDTSEHYKEKLTEVRARQKQLVRDKVAVICGTEWTVSGSKREGQKMVNQISRLMLRAFNGESDAAVSKVRWNNIQRMEERLQKAFKAINTLGSTQHIEITEEYSLLKMEELRLTHEYQEKLQEEKEEQRRIREQMREEEKARREIEKAQRDAEAEEKRYQDTLEKARLDVSEAHGEKLDKLNSQIVELEKRLQEAHENKERALSRAQMTKSGHVYVISNIGSFGEGVFKIGMTRRLTPMDRVKELGDASVPFEFDVHAMIYSENAPELETAIHREFESRRVNLINQRKEFFKVSFDEIKQVVDKNHGEIELTKLAEAKEYRETLAMLEQEEDRKSVEEKVEEQFPSVL